jgi:hypothetical protein
MKIAIASILIAALTCGLILLLRYVNASGKVRGTGRHPSKRRSSRSAAALLSAQDSLGLADIVGTAVIMRDGAVVTLIEVDCKNVSLMTRADKEREARRTASVLSTLEQGFSIIKIHRESDNSQALAEYGALIRGIDDEVRQMEQGPVQDADKKRRQFLLARRSILAEAHQEAVYRTGGAKEKLVTQTVICLRTEADEDAVRVAQAVAMQLMGRLSESGYSSRLLADRQIIDFLAAYLSEPQSKKINLDPYGQIPLWSCPGPEVGIENEVPYVRSA